MTTKVAFVKDWDGDEIVAVFPDEKHSHFGSDVVMYVRVGQHTSGSLEWARKQQDPTVPEFIDLYNELVRIGYDDLELTTL